MFVRAIALCPLAAILALSAQAQSAAPAVRIVSPIDESQLVTMRGSMNPAAIGAIDRGSVSASLPMVLTMVLSRSAEEQAAFDAFVASQYDQNSPNFHQWLSPQQIGQRFGPAQSDISTLSSWLAGHGFAVKSVGPDGMTIQFSGTAGQVENAFHADIHNLSAQGQAHIANITDPQIPAALAPLVVGIKGLHNFLPHPLHRLGSKVQFNPNAHGWVKMQTSSGAGFTPVSLRAQAPAASANSASSTKPNFYIANFNLGVEEDVAPFDFAKIYNLPSTWPTSANGAGQTITIVGTSDIELGDVANFKSAFGLPAGTAPVIAHGPDGDPGVCTGSTNACNSDDLDENSLDVEWSGAVAAGAQIVLVTNAYNSQSAPTNDPVFDGAQWAIDNAYVKGSPVYGSRILSSSYGECELFNGTASNVAYNNLWQTAASGGIAVFVAAGDSGSPSCDQGGDGVGNPYVAQYGLSVSAMASSPYDTAVGGTDFSWCNPTFASNGQTINGCTASNASTYWNTSNNSQQASAKGYVPETPWNDTCQNPINAALLASVATVSGVSGVSTPEEACNFVYEDSLNLYFESDGPALMSYADTVGGSGGASSCVVNTSTYTTAGSCSATDTTSTGSSYGNLPLVNNGWPKPSWQTAAASLGVPADGVRDLPDVSFFAGDGTLDSASLICVSNDGATCTNISETGSTNPSDTGGAEEIGGTSVATPEMAGVMALINQKIGAPQGSPNAELYTLAGKQTYANCSAEGGSTSNGCYFNDINQGTNTMPCATTDKVVEGGATFDFSTGQWEETPQLFAAASPNCAAINSGDTIGTISGYSAVAGYDQTTGLGSLNIANVVANWTAATVGTAPATVSISLGGVTSITESQSLNVTVTVSGAGATPTGDLTLSASANGYNAAQILSSGTATFTIPANTFTANGTVTLTAAYSGDSSYASNSGTASFTVTGAASAETFALGSITAPAGIAPGGTATATVAVSSSSGYAGTITLNCLLTNEPSGAVNLPSCSPSGTITLSAAATSGTATVSVTTTAATVESGSLTPASRKGLFGAGGGAVLALLVFFGIPARRRSWRAMFGMVVLLVTLGSLTACGGGGGNSTTTIPGTTAGTYTFTVTPVGSPAPSSAPSSQTFTVTVSGVGVG
jgi:subtilase family serine protease